MPDRRATPSDAGDPDATPPRGTPVGRLRGDDEPWPNDEFGRREPNYLVRRAIVVAVVVAAVAALAIVVGWVIDGDDSPSTSTSDAADWNTIIVISDDRIELLDRESLDERATIESARDLTDVQAVVAGNVLVTMTDDGEIVQTDLDDGEIRRGLSGPDETLRISPDNPAIATSSADAGGDVTVIDTRKQTTLSVSDVAGVDDPLIFGRDVLVNPSGSHAAVPVPNAFQSVVLDLVAETSFALAGRVIAIDDERIVTEQPAGDESELEFYDLMRDRLGTVDVAAPRASLLRDDGRLLTVDENGKIVLVDDGGSIDEVGDLIDPDGRPVDVERGIRAADGERLLVVGSRSVYLLDADGDQVGVAAGEPAASIRSGASCAVVDERGRFTLYDLDDGEAIVSLEGGRVGSTSYDGCTASFVGADPRIVHDGEVIGVDGGSIATVAPDGQGFVVVDERDSIYVEIGDDPTAIAPRDADVLFGQRE